MAVEVRGFDEMNARLAELMADAESKVVRVLSYLGEQCVIEARDRTPEESWYDRTGNLRNSIGYCITRQGDIVAMSGFAGNSEEGKRSGKGLAQAVAKTITDKYALIVVAGMHYAVYVEAMDDKVVLASSELYARQKLPQLMQKLKEQLAKTRL